MLLMQNKIQVLEVDQFCLKKKNTQNKEDLINNAFIDMASTCDTLIP